MWGDENPVRGVYRDGVGIFPGGGGMSTFLATGLLPPSPSRENLVYSINANMKTSTEKYSDEKHYSIKDTCKLFNCKNYS